MTLLERIKKIQGADTALGLTFCGKKSVHADLPEGSVLFGYTNNACFCFVEGFQETVFVIEPAAQPCPVAYDIREFLRLILACGSAGNLIQGMHRPSRTLAETYKENHDTLSADLEQLKNTLGLTPIPDPWSYIRTVQQVIDYRRIMS